MIRPIIICPKCKNALGFNMFLKRYFCCYHNCNFRSRQYKNNEDVTEYETISYENIYKQKEPDKKPVTKRSTTKRKIQEPISDNLSNALYKLRTSVTKRGQNEEGTDNDS